MDIIELFIDENDEVSGIEAISVVEQPAIEEDFIALKNQEFKLAEVDKEKRILMGAALIPNKPIYRKSGDQEYYIYFSRDTVRKASELFFIRGNQSNSTFEHQLPLEGLTAVESWIVESEKDKSRMYNLNVPIGTWMVSMKVNNDEVWKQVKAGEVKGFSIEGYFADKLERPNEPVKDDLEMKAQKKIEELKELFSTQKVDLGVIQDFTKLFEKALDKSLKISLPLLDALSKARGEYIQNNNDWERALKKSEELLSAYKNLGVDIPQIIKNKILSCEAGIKENQKIISATKKFKSAITN